jgi:hypothetical protein
MKSFYAFLFAALLAVPTVTTSSAIEIDGIAEGAYGSALATQTIGTSFGDSSSGLYTNANGSEIDAAYGFISNSVLYIFFAGNLENNFNKLEIFIDSIAGHGQNTLTNNNSGVDFNGLNRMGGNAGVGTNGLTFDAGFAPDYWLGTTIGGNPASFYANYGVLLDNGGGIGYYMGTANPTNHILSGGTNPFGVQATINNSNTGGVDGNGCVTNASNVAQSIAAATVTTGMELAIPLSAVSSGALSTVKVCAFINGSGHDFVSNQILGGIATNDCVTNSLGEPRAINMGTLPGVHYFVVPVVGCNYAISPTSMLYPNIGGSGSVTMTAGAGCLWAATSQVAWVTITSGASGNGNGTLNYSVGTNTTTVGRSGSIIIGGQTFTINQYGQPLALPIDGTVETNHYGCAPLAVQQLGTSFNDATVVSVDSADGSELDAAYGVIENGVLYLVLSGNLSSDFTKLEIFFETGPGGENTLANTNPDVDFNGLNRMGPNGNGAYTNGPSPGLTFDANFAPTYWMGVTCGGAPFAVFANYAQLVPGGSNGYFLGSTVGSTNGTLFSGNNPAGIQVAINNINTLGVLGDSAFDDPSIYGQGSVTTGVELGIPLTAIGSPTGAVKVCAFVNGSGHDLVSNQILGPIDGSVNGGTGTNNLGEASLVNLSALPGQHYFLVGPEMRITGVSKSGSDISVRWLSGANSHLAYQLQRTGSLTPASWGNVGSPTNGTGLAITQTDITATTNTAYFYRVKQTPVCP